MSLPVSLPPIGADEEWVPYIMASARTSVASSARQVLDTQRFRNDGSYDAYVTDVVMEETGGGLLNLAIEILDTQRKRDILKNQSSCVSLGTPDAVGQTLNNTLGFYTSRWALPTAYRLAADSGFQITLEELGGAARTARVTVIAYQKLRKQPPPQPS